MRLNHQPLVRDGLPDHPPFGRSRGRHGLRQHGQRAGAGHADEARQKPGAAAIRDEADPGEGLHKAGAPRRQHDIAGQREIGAGAGGDPVDRADDRHRQGAQLPDERVVMVDQARDLGRRHPDDRGQILPGAKGAPGAGDEEGAAALVGLGRGERAESASAISSVKALSRSGRLSVIT